MAMASIGSSYDDSLDGGDVQVIGSRMGGMSLSGRGDGRRGGDSAMNSGLDRGARGMILPALNTRPKDRENKKGEGGAIVKCLTNYISVDTRPDFHIYQYHVHFQPVIDSKHVRQQLIHDRQDLFGPEPIFDGMILYRGTRFDEEPYVFSGLHPNTNENITITIKLTNELPPDDPQCLTILNLCSRQVFEMAGYKQLGRNYYNPTNVAAIPAHKIEIWPGMVSAIRCHERQLLMVCEMSHKILRTDTVFNLMDGMINAGGNRAIDNIMQALIGCTVLTRYNNKTYRIDDIMWDMTPENTFELEDGRTMSFVEYYRDNYQLTVTNMRQPLLMSRGKRRANAASDDNRTVYLVPELCAMTGLTDQMREDRRIMQDLAKYTRVAPKERIAHVRKYLNGVQTNAASRALFERWGIRLGTDALQIEARELEPEEITFATRSVRYDRTTSDWSRECRSITLNDPHPLKDWLIVYSAATKLAAEEFYKHSKVLGPASGMLFTEPALQMAEDDSVRSFLTAIKEGEKANPDLKIVVAVVPNDNKTRYDAIKKYCCLESIVPSQVIRHRSLEKNTISVVSKILLQMNCKLGGSLWRVKLPLGNTMIIGYDLYHDSSSKSKKVGAAVFSMNMQYTKWYSQCAQHENLSQLANNLAQFCTNGLKKYEKLNGQLPERIILFRDGVGDGHIPVVFKEELPQIRSAFKEVGGSEYKPRFAFVIVTKRVHTRYFKIQGNDIVNPIPGTVVDDIVTRPERYDFYLVPQAVRQGTVTPVSYNVIFDESGLEPKNMQKLAYKLCHLYYNWQGTIRVPAPCQLAHKLAFLVGQTLHSPVHDTLADKLFFL